MTIMMPYIISFFTCNCQALWEANIFVFYQLQPCCLVRSSPCVEWCPAQWHTAMSPHQKCLPTSLPDMGSPGTKDESPPTTRNYFMMTGVSVCVTFCVLFYYICFRRMSLLTVRWPASHISYQIHCIFEDLKVRFTLRLGQEKAKVMFGVGISLQDTSVTSNEYRLKSWKCDCVCWYLFIWKWIGMRLKETHKSNKTQHCTLCFHALWHKTMSWKKLVCW